MKPVIPIILFLCIAGCACQSKLIPKSVDYLTAPDQSRPEEINFGDRVQVKLINVNRFIYKVSADTASQDFNTAVPSIFSALTLPATIAAGGGGRGFPSAVDKDAAQPPAVLRRGLQEEHDNIVHAADAINRAVNAHNEIMEISANCEKAGAVIIQDALNRLLVLVATDHIAGADIQAIAENWKRFAVDEVAKANAAWKSVNQYSTSFAGSRYKRHQIEILAAQVKLVGRQHDLDNATEAIKAIKDKTRLAAAQADLLEKKNDVATAQDEMNRTKEDFDHDTKTVADIVAEAKELWQALHKLTDDGKIYVLFDDMKKVNPASFEYNAPLVKMTRDEMKVTFTVTSDALLPCNRPNEKKFPYTMRTRKGIKVDFSTGLFVSGGNVDFLGKDYYYRPVNDTTSTIAYSSAGKKAIVSIGALMHIYFRSTWLVKPALSIGASLNTGATIVNLHAGPSLIIGNKNRIVVSGGLTLRESNVLDHFYTEYKEYDVKLLPSAIPTVTKFPIAGYFFSITYNLSSLGN